MANDTETDERSTVFESDNSHVAGDVVDTVTSKMLRVARVVAKKRLDAIPRNQERDELQTMSFINFDLHYTV